MKTTQIGLDLAKSVVEVAVSHQPGRVHARHRLSRARVRRFFAAHAPAEVLMEACGSAHHWGRELQALGHQVALLPAADVARYRDGNKTDRADAKAVLEAARNEAINRVPVKSVEQQALTALHRLRQGYLQTRTARINAVRGHLREFGITIPIGALQIRWLGRRRTGCGTAGAIPRDLVVRDRSNAKCTVDLGQGVGCREVVQRTPGASCSAQWTVAWTRRGDSSVVASFPTRAEEKPTARYMPSRCSIQPIHSPLSTTHMRPIS